MQCVTSSNFGLTSEASAIQLQPFTVRMANWFCSTARKPTTNAICSWFYRTNAPRANHCALGVEGQLTDDTKGGHCVPRRM